LDSCLETDRLILRPVKASDAGFLQDALSDPVHMRFTASTTDFASSQGYFRSLEQHWQRHGFGAWAMVHRQTSEILGWGGLILDEDEPGWGPELVYFMVPSHTGHGYAFELGNAATVFGFETLGLDKICAFAKQDNHPSRRLLGKLGFHKVRFVASLDRDYFERLP